MNDSKKEAPDMAELQKLTGDPKKFLVAMKQKISSMSKEFKPADREDSFKYLNRTVALLRKDSDRSFGLFEESFSNWATDSQNTELMEEMQFRIRQLIRTFFAEVEGTLYAARRVVLWAYERGEISLNTAEIAVLREETYKFNPRTREAEARPAFNTTKEAFLLVFTFLPRLTNPDFKLDLTNNGWERFQKLLEVRHELTHPKEIIKLILDADTIMEIMPGARVWYYESLKQAVGFKKK
jgi:hypothetical protein